VPPISENFSVLACPLMKLLQLVGEAVVKVCKN